jgi:hypothetical protein
MATIAVLTLLAAIVAAVSTPATAAGQPSFGYNDDWFTVGNHRIGQAIAGGADTIRVPFSWAPLEAKRGAMSWGGYDDVYQRILASGARPLILLIGVPCWAAASKRCSDGSFIELPDRKHLDSWGRFVGQVARRYPLARGLEIWNEQNFTKFWRGKLNPERYGRILRAAALGAGRTNPAMPIISGGLLPSPDNDRTQMAYPKFLERSLRTAGPQNYDGVGIHPFPFFADDYLGKVREVIRKTRRITRRTGGRNKELWVTEVGVSTAPPDNYSVRKQATALGRIYDALARMRDVAAIIVHRFIDDPKGSKRDKGWGVTNPDGSVKPAYCALAKRRGVPCGTYPASASRR